MLDLDGRIVMSTVGDHERRDQSEEEYFIRGSSGTYVQPAGDSSLSEQPTIMVATPLFGRDGQRIGVVAASPEPRHARPDRPSGYGPRTDRRVLPGGQGRAPRPPSPGSGEVQAGRLSSQGIDRALRGVDGRGLYESYAGAPVIGVYQWLDEVGAALVSEQTQDAAFAPARRLALTLAAISLVVAALLALAIYAALAAHRAAHPGHHRYGHCRRGGRPDTRGSRDHRATRSETLAVAFNAMTSRLRETLEGLEQRVAERTEELRIQNAELGALHETTLGVMHRLELADLLEELLGRAGELLSSSHGYIYVHRPGENEIETARRLRRVRGGPRPEDGPRRGRGGPRLGDRGVSRRRRL